MPMSSPRAVTAVSSKCGWRCRIRAAIAPANPAAPMTATVSATELGPDPVGKRRDNLLPLPRGVLLGERAVRRAELEVQRERRAPAANPLAAVDVENRRVRQELGGAARGADDVARGHVVPDDERDVLPHDGEEPERLEGLGARRGQPAEVELEERRGGEVPRGGHSGMELTEVSEVADVRAAA